MDTLLKQTWKMMHILKKTEILFIILDQYKFSIFITTKISWPIYIKKKEDILTNILFNKFGIPKYLATVTEIRKCSNLRAENTY